MPDDLYQKPMKSLYRRGTRAYHFMNNLLLERDRQNLTKLITLSSDLKPIEPQNALKSGKWAIHTFVKDKVRLSERLEHPRIITFLF